jgi:hypothetical protein
MFAHCLYNNYSYSHLKFEISLMNLKTKSGIRWSQPYRSPTLSTNTPCSEAERLGTTANVTPETTNSNSLLPNTASNDIQQHVNSANSGDVDIRNLTVTLIRSCAPEVMVPDARVFSSMKNEQKYPWLYDSVVHKGYLCKLCELFFGPSSSSQECVTVFINLGTV